MRSPACWFRPRTPLRWPRRLIRLARSPSLRARLGEAGYAVVAERFSIDAQVRRIEELYDEELQRAGALAPLRGSGKGSSPEAPLRPRGRAALEVPPL